MIFNAASIGAIIAASIGPFGFGYGSLADVYSGLSAGNYGDYSGPLAANYGSFHYDCDEFAGGFYSALPGANYYSSQSILLFFIYIAASIGNFLYIFLFFRNTTFVFCSHTNIIYNI